MQPHPPLLTTNSHYSSAACGLNLSGRTASTLTTPCRTFQSFRCVLISHSNFVLLSDPREYLRHVMKVTNMSCLTPEGALSGECDFLSANMYARSLFGEDALANLSIERTGAGAITGHVRIRSKTQGIALSLGDKITMGMLVFHRSL